MKRWPNVRQELAKNNNALVRNFEGSETRHHLIHLILVLKVRNELAVGVVLSPFLGHLVEENGYGLVWAKLTDLFGN